MKKLARILSAIARFLSKEEVREIAFELLEDYVESTPSQYDDRALEIAKKLLSKAE